ncbi:MAG: histidine phosphatase family protein [Bifidobacteriaceae bacterium]|jgi:broad specificity phosphatase PhoE|nr:histidine phosphatase family protein [Bifidobacteriaceae bacterium]
MESVTAQSESMLPETLVFVRHGESDENRIEKLGMRSVSLLGRLKYLLNKRKTKHLDYDLLLSEHGIHQAEVAGESIKQNFQNFDIALTSPYLRAIQTAEHMKLDMNWEINNLLMERDWGFRYLNDRTKKFKRDYNSNVYFITSADGEKLYSVMLRANQFLDLLKHRECKRVISVTHNEFIFTMMDAIENLPVHVHIKNYRENKLPNCAIVAYTRINPKDNSEIRDNFAWRKVIDPINPSNSWDGGEWHEIANINSYTEQELGKIVADSESKFLYK